VVTVFDQLIKVHAQIFTAGLNQNFRLGAKLVNMYAMFGAMDYAHQVFDGMPEGNVLVWNALIRGYAGNGTMRESLGSVLPNATCWATTGQIHLSRCTQSMCRVISSARGKEHT
ncbi:hypothetical protein KI387_006608, partial [Taxus chinensis]